MRIQRLPAGKYDISPIGPVLRHTRASSYAEIFRLIPELFSSDATIQDSKSANDSEHQNAGKALHYKAGDKTSYKTLYLSPALFFRLFCPVRQHRNKSLESGTFYLKYGHYR